MSITEVHSETVQVVVSSDFAVPFLRLTRGQRLPLARIFHTVGGALINAAALARRKDALSLGELFQQFVSRDGKPLKRLLGCSCRRHRAEAPVLVRMGVTRYEISGPGTNREARIARIDPAEPLVYAPAR
jgi:hypothetical protein